MCSQNLSQNVNELFLADFTELLIIGDFFIVLFGV